MISGVKGLMCSPLFARSTSVPNSSWTGLAEKPFVQQEALPKDVHPAEELASFLIFFGIDIRPDVAIVNFIFAQVVAVPFDLELAPGIATSRSTGIHPG